MAEKLTPVEKLMQYMDACARIRGEMMFTQGYRTRLNATNPQDPELIRLYEKEQHQSAYCGVVEARFRRYAGHLLRKAGKQKARRPIRRRVAGDSR